MKLEELAGQQLMIGISGTQVTPETVALFRETHAGGVIFFRPNFSSAEAFKRLIADLESALGRKLLVAVDHEGGRVIHLAEGITVFPDNLALGHTGKVEYASKQGTIEAKELRRLGIDLNLAPTLDVLTKTFSPNIGIRSYGEDPELVAKLGAARIKTMQAEGLSACAKHFPGLGQAPVDPHIALPVLPTTWDEMKSIHLTPFLAAIKAGVDTVMSSHPVYPNLDPANIPVTFSKRIIRDYLRKELGFKGVILSDDLEMGALRDIASFGESACRAIEAGHDMVLVCHNPDAQREAADTLIRAYHDRRLDYVELEKSVARLEKLKKKRSVRFEKGAPLAESAGNPLAERIAKEALEKTKIKAKLEGSLTVIFPKLSTLENRIFIESELQQEEKFIADLLKHYEIEPKAIQIVKMDPTDHDIQEARMLAGISDSVLFFCFDAHLFAQCRRLLEAVQTTAKRCAVVLLRDPYDQEFINKEVTCVQTFGFRAVQIRAVFDLLFSHR